MSEVLLDSARSVTTPEGIDLQLRPAGPVVRSLAYLIDFVLRLVTLLVVSQLLFFVPDGLGLGIFLVLFFLLEWIAPAWCEVTFAGATPGKKVMGMVVLYQDGRPVGWRGALLRNLLRAADFLPFAFGAGLICMTLTRDFRRLGDLVGGTVVVYRDAAVRDRSVPIVEPVAPQVILSLAEQRAVIDFAASLPAMTGERAIELAELATPITRGIAGQAAVDRLVGVANHFLGRRA